MKKKHLRELERINESIPKEWLDNLTIMEDQFPTLREIATRAQKDPKVKKEDKVRFKAMLDSGYLDKKVLVINQPVEKKISDYVEGEIAKAVKLGRLPKKASASLSLKGLRNAKRKHKKGSDSKVTG